MANNINKVNNNNEQYYNNEIKQQFLEILGLSEDSKAVYELSLIHI